MKKRTLVTSTFEEVAKKMGIDIHIEPGWGYVGKITLPDGRTRYFRNTNFDLNGLGASEIARDKSYAEYFMKRMGYPVIPGKTFYTKEWCRTIDSDQGPEAAYQFAKHLGFPVVVKPNSGSQGKGVCKVINKREFLQAMKELERIEQVFLVQRFVAGLDYRIVVLDGVVISAYQRLPLSITGDSKSTVRGLLTRKQYAFRHINRNTKINLDDWRIVLMLRHIDMTMGSIPDNGVVIPLLPNANLSTGGDVIDVTSRLHREWKRLAKRLARDMNLRYVGIDVMSQTSLAESPRDYMVIEINAAPGLDAYASIGPRQKGVVEELYRKILIALSK